MEAEVIAQALSPIGVVVCSRSEPSEHLQQGLTADGRKNELVYMACV
jgi:hypothetical protein